MNLTFRSAFESVWTLCVHRIDIVSCLFSFLLYMFTASHLFVCSAIFDHNHEVHNISAAYNIFCHNVLLHTSDSFLDLSAIFIMRDTCVSTESHDINLWINCFFFFFFFLILMILWETLWQLWLVNLKDAFVPLTFLFATHIAQKRKFWHKDAKELKMGLKFMIMYVYVYHSNSWQLIVLLSLNEGGKKLIFHLGKYDTDPFWHQTSMCKVKIIIPSNYEYFSQFSLRNFRFAHAKLLY